MTTEKTNDSGRNIMGRLGWIRAAVLGANGGLISVASLVVGVAASGPTLRAF